MCPAASSSIPIYTRTSFPSGEQDCRKTQIPWDPKQLSHTHRGATHPSCSQTPQSHSGLNSSSLVAAQRHPTGLWVRKTPSEVFGSWLRSDSLRINPLFLFFALLLSTTQHFCVSWVKHRLLECTELIFFLWVLPNPTWAKPLRQDYPQGLTLPSFPWATLQGQGWISPVPPPQGSGLISESWGTNSTVETLEGPSLEKRQRLNNKFTRARYFIQQRCKQVKLIYSYCI